jgi:hypothetical protein
MRRILATVFVMTAFVSCERASSRQALVAPNNHPDCVSMDFRFIELKDLAYSTSTLKHVEVFLDEKSFSEENLKLLLDYLSKEHAAWKYLVVEVKTNWAQIQPFSDCPGTGTSNMPEPPDKYDYYQAVMYRSGENQFFNYYPKLKSQEIKTVVSKGKHCWFTSPAEMCQ